VRLIEGDAALTPGSALDLGCGTGTNVLYLARNGWRALGVDFSSSAIERATSRLSEAVADDAALANRVAVLEGDVTRLSLAEPVADAAPFDLVLDIGCFHGLPSAGRADYAREVAGLTHPGSVLLMFAFAPTLRRPWGPSTRESEVRRRFDEVFELAQVEPGKRPRGAAWFTLVRR
jgi:SAM-dependent methyltransferase